MGVLIITHYQRILHMVKPQFVHIMFEGRIVKEGGPELVTELEEKGYGWIRDEVAAARHEPRRPHVGRVPRPRAGGSGLSRHGRHLADRAAGAGGDGPLLRDVPRQHPPRRLPAGRRGDGGLRGRARPGRARSPARRPARRSSRATPPRPSTSSRARGAARTSARRPLVLDRRWSTTRTSCRGSCSAAGSRTSR